jgi:hypothetical protein
MEFKCPIEPKPYWCSEQCKTIDESDPQKIRLYCLEESLESFKNDKNKLSLEECRVLASKVCSDYNVPSPLIKDGRSLKVAKGGFDKIGNLTIRLPKMYRNRITVLHEATHCVMKYLTLNDGIDHENHGPIYIRYLLDVYSRYLDVPISLLESVAKKFNLEIADKEKVIRTT